MERAQLSAARNRLHFSLEEVARHIGVSRVTVHRWEKHGDIPQPYHRRKLCELYAMTAQELGFEVTEMSVVRGPALSAFRARNLTLRLVEITYLNVHYQEVQRLVNLECKEESMDTITRRDALIFLASLPLSAGLSALGPALRRPREEVLSQTAGGIAACWLLIKGDSPAEPLEAIESYVPTLKAIMQDGTTTQRQAAADLLAQCFFLQARYASHVQGNFKQVIATASVAERYAMQAANVSLQAECIAQQADALYDLCDYNQALSEQERALFLLQQAKEPVSPLLRSEIQCDLAQMRAKKRDKQQALRTLGKAHENFFQATADDPPGWITQNLGGLIFSDAMTHALLNMHSKALDTLNQYHAVPGQSPLGHVQMVIRRAQLELLRDDQPRDLEYVIANWTEGVQGARKLGSRQRMNEALHVFDIMQGAWPGEPRIQALQDYLF